MTATRIIGWWSAGAASAVACSLALAQGRREGIPVALVYCDTGAEHGDNERFRRDCEAWYDYSIATARSATYASPWEVWERTGWLVGVNGARCTTELKKKVRRQIEQPGDLQVFGFTVEERARAERFAEQNVEVQASFPLLDYGLTKADCLALLRAQGIALPAMYALGYRNNNCIGCVKGGMGYWNKIREDFPEVFARMVKLERTLDVSILRSKGERLFLDELAPGRGRYDAEPEVECGLACEAARKDGR